ncbi:FMN-dependent NADH-azoreductase [Bacillus cytotoxicus]|uniref:FMN-dependent NADH-azoreductase n=1 Tax=Bacillus cereus group sp. BfR-BA-01492 TaxID=2920361 RepID=UPI001F5A708D|nr:FMN-dependent NADH-azoreductase [Bacillus cereus group sp. BfR-BA-01492]EMA6344081.1 FMN-dependent NADH-azoreductase [Bacillus cytotoxicus]
MANLLYITAHPFDETRSYSMEVGKVFLESYKELHPNDEIVHLDLYKADIPYLDTDVFNGWEKLRLGIPLHELSPIEISKVGRLAELGGQFILADKYVFVTPMWNFSIPAILKTYLDAVAVSGKTFKYTKQGATGLLTGKKALHIQARGDIYSEEPEAHKEMGHRYLQVMMEFFGTSFFEGIFIEGHNKYPEKAEEIKENAMKRAKEVARYF